MPTPPIFFMISGISLAISRPTTCAPCSARDSAIANPMLMLVRDTFWASAVERDIGWFLMNGVVETPKAKAIRYLVNNCIQEMRPIAEQITQAFAIPDQVLAAPIAFDALPTRHG